MTKRSAGILLYRIIDGTPEVLLVHPGGPFWANKDAGVWSLPKGEYEPDEAPLAAALRELTEETGAIADPAQAVDLGTITQRNGKIVTAWAIPGDFDTTALVSNPVIIEWPRGSAKTLTFPEVDRAEWLTPDAARTKLLPAQTPFIDRLLTHLGDTP